MATTLIVNTGSTSKKFSLFADGILRASVRLEVTPAGHEMCVSTETEELVCSPITLDAYDNALAFTLTTLQSRSDIADVSAIDAVGVRVVAPGTEFTKHQEVTEAFLAALSARESLAPLHIPPTLTAISQVTEALPQARIVAVSDSAFHTSRPEFVWRYSLPQADADTYDLHKFGYHGLSMASIARRLPEVFSAVPARTIVCHLGGGISMTALRDGRSFDTTMGFAPASGLMMSGRGGDLDAALLLGLMESKQLSVAELHDYLNHQCGFTGVAGVSDMRSLLDKVAAHDADGELAFAMFTHQFKKTIGSLIAALGGLDALVLTATAAVRNPMLRFALLEPLKPLGIEVDRHRNQETVNTDGRLEHADSRVQLAVMTTDELGEMDRVTQSFLK
ncbi:hypothetical protein H6783_00535 [Candidatus Nomurabacteria bacterium]|nr:hypothetical protein [Candidatus Nomurabacteria bacterium]